MRLLSSDTAMLRAVAGMVPSGKADIEPDLVRALTEELRQLLP